MKTYLLKFNNKEEALDILIPLGFGYNSISRGRIILENVFDKFYTRLIPSTDEFFRIQIDTLEDSEELKNKLSQYIME